MAGIAGDGAVGFTATGAAAGFAGATDGLATVAGAGVTTAAAFAEAADGLESGAPMRSGENAIKAIAATGMVLPTTFQADNVFMFGYRSPAIKAVLPFHLRRAPPAVPTYILLISQMSDLSRLCLRSPKINGPLTSSSVAK
jgi:hypothetical protein